MRILIAPNAFKGGVNAVEAAAAIANGLLASPLACTATKHPVGDGGDGTAALLMQRFNARIVRANVQDPIGRPIAASFGVTPDGTTAIIGMSGASGLRLLKEEERDPLNATSYGTGQLMVRALEEKVSNIVLGVGGSATIDAGTGIVRALGGRFLGKNGREIAAGPEALVDLATIDLSGLNGRLSRCRITILCDVDNPLLGQDAAGKVFGPQKGASEEDIALLECGLTRLAVVLLEQTGTNVWRLPRGGAAGGVAAGLHAMLGAELVQGVTHFLDLTGFDAALAEADLVVTAEGAIDDQTLCGKAPMGVAMRAKAAEVPVIALVGRAPLIPSAKLSNTFDMLLPIGDGPASLDDAIRDTRCNLERTAYQIGAFLAASQKRRAVEAR